MAKKCVSCGKKPVIGHAVSHSNKKSLRAFNPNLQKVNIVLAGKKIKAYVCTKCLKAGKIVKAPLRA
jgi:large subunit ribosomal protein L28